GTYRWHLLRAAPFRDQDGNIIKWLGSATDIEDQKRAAGGPQIRAEELEQRVKERTVELLTSNDRLSELAQVAAHDLQEPLRMVASYTQLLARRYQGKLDPDADEFIKYVMDGTLRMQSMVAGLLTYSQAGSAPGAMTQVDCNQVFNEAVSNLQIAIQESNATVTCESLPAVYANPTSLLQLFQNLISNAIKFRADWPLKIHVGAERKNGVWQFSVRDNGIGIEPRYSSQIFMLFQRLPGQAKHPGTGIGLAICKKIVESLGGKIWVDSKAGEGSTFYFTLPDKEDTSKNA
ncbi:MAG: ATP-binding protein, partial [Gammaproteobacteria bacterium]